jgi:hypothetical protein
VFSVQREGHRALVKRTATISGEAVSRWCRILGAAGVPVATPWDTYLPE